MSAPTPLLLGDLFERLVSLTRNVATVGFVDGGFRDVCTALTAEVACLHDADRAHAADAAVSILAYTLTAAAMRGLDVTAALRRCLARQAAAGKVRYPDGRLATPEDFAGPTPT